MPNWWNKPNNSNQDDKDDKDEIELKPSEVKAKLDEISGLKTSIEELKSKSGILDRMDAYLVDQDKLKNEAKARELAEKALKTKKETNEELEDLYLTDPKAATERAVQEATAPLIESNINTSSYLIRNELFSNKEQYPYYHGEFKQEVDKWITQLPMKARTDPASIANCYDLVLGKKWKDIQEGKLKTIFAASADSSSTSGGTNTGGDKPVTLSEAEKKAARALGIKEEDYAKSKKDMSYV